MNEIIDNDIQQDTTTDVKTAARVILYDDNIHTFDEVIFQLMKAVKCSSQQAEKHAYEVHNTGKSCVFSGDMMAAVAASHILEEIGLITQIEV